MLRTAIVGAGHWGRRLIESVQGRSEKIGFTAAVTRDPVAQQPLAARYGLALSRSYAAVLADHAIDAVVLATPHSQHADEVVAAAEAGKESLCSAVKSKNRLPTTIVRNSKNASPNSLAA